MNRATAGLGLSGVLSSSILSVIISIAVYFMMQTDVPATNTNAPVQQIPKALQLTSEPEFEEPEFEEPEFEEQEEPEQKVTPIQAPTITQEPVPQKVQSPEVFLYLKGGYDKGYTKSQAYDVCPNGSVLASESQLEEAQRSGADWCAYGWTTGRAGYPQQTSGIPGCSLEIGGAKTYFSDDAQSTKRGATCYGPKPYKGTDDRVHPFNKSLWSRFD